MQKDQDGTCSQLPLTARPITARLVKGRSAMFASGLRLVNRDKTRTPRFRRLEQPDLCLFHSLDAQSALCSYAPLVQRIMVYSKFWPKGGLPGILHHYVSILLMSTRHKKSTCHGS